MRDAGRGVKGQHSIRRGQSIDYGSSPYFLEGQSLLQGGRIGEIVDYAFLLGLGTTM